MNASAVTLSTEHPPTINPPTLFRTLCAVMLALTLWSTSPAMLHAQSASFAGAQTTAISGLNGIASVTLDAQGDFFFLEYDSVTGDTLTEVTPSGVQIPVPVEGLNGASQVAIDTAGNVFIADTFNNRVVEVPKIGNSYGSQSVVPTTGLYTPGGVAVDAAGNLFITQATNYRVIEVTPAGVQTTVTTDVWAPGGITVDGNHNLFIADTYDNRILEVAADGSEIATPTPSQYPIAVAVDKSGNVFFLAWDVLGNTTLTELPWTGNGYGAPISLASGLNDLSGVAVDESGNVFIADSGNNRLVEVQIKSVNFGSVNVCPAGQTTPAPCSQTVPLTFNITSSGTLGTPNVLTQGAPNLDFTEAGGSTCTGAVTAGSTCAVNVTLTPTAPGPRSGTVQLTDSSGNVLATTLVYGAGHGAAIAYGPGIQKTLPVTGLSTPNAIATDAAGNVFITNLAPNNPLVKITANGVQTTIPVSVNEPYGVAVDGAGDLFIADSAYSRVLEVPWTGSGYGAQVTVPASGLSTPNGVAVDGAGNLFIADTFNNRVVELPWTGSSYGAQITVPASGLTTPNDVAVDGAGNLFIADTFNNRVVELPWTGSSFGTQVTVPTNGFHYPERIAVDPANDLFITEPGDGVVVELPWTGSSFGDPITVPIVGSNSPDPFYVYGVALDAAGDLFITDSNNDQVLELQRSQPPSLSFATTPVGQTSSDSPQSFTIQNVGNQPLTAAGSGLSIGANFEQATGSGTPEDCTASFSLTPGASCNLSISFTPTMGGSIQSSVVLTDNALNANPAMQTIQLNGTATAVSQTINFPALPNVTYGVAPISLTATASSGLTVSFISNTPAVCSVTGTTATVLHSGTCTIEAYQIGNADYQEAKVQTSFTVNPAVLTVTPSPNNLSQTYGTAIPTFTYAVTGFVNGDSASVVSGTATLSTTATGTSAPGMYPISFSTEGLSAANYTFNYVPGSLTITSASQTITFNPIAGQAQGANLALSATSSSGLPVSFTSLTPGVCTVSGTTAILAGSGSCTIQASQAGNANYAAATPVSQSFTVLPSFTITPIPRSETIERGVLAAFILQLNAGNGFSGNVTLSCSGGPAGAQCADLPRTVKLKSNGVAYAISGILFPKTTAPGTYTMTFTGVSGSLTEATTATFTVTK